MGHQVRTSSLHCVPSHGFGVGGFQEGHGLFPFSVQSERIVLAGQPHASQQQKGKEEKEEGVQGKRRIRISYGKIIWDKIETIFCYLIFRKRKLYKMVN